MNLLTVFWILSLIAVSNCYVEFQPEQIHLALGENSRDIVVTWSTPQKTKDSISIVEYGIEIMNLKAEGVENLFVDGGKKKKSQEIHRVVLQNLKPDTVYKYRCGGKKGWSPIFTFKTFPMGDNWVPHIAIYGDMGNIDALSLPQLQKEAQDGVYDAVIHIGDFAYDMADNNGEVGDEFMRQIEPLAAYVPYIVSPGNHESHYNFSHYKQRFTMPGGNQGLYFSYNIGPIHFISYSSEMYYFPEYLGPERQYQWLIEELERSTQLESRAKHPWIIVVGHRPMYCNSASDDDCTNINAKNRVGIENNYGLEKLFYDYGVDLQIYGHVHTYERYFPMYDYKVYNGSLDEPYTNPNSPVHVTTGSAGCKYGHDRFREKPHYLAFRSRDYGYSRFKVYNSSHLYFEQFSINQDKVIDSFWISKTNHKKFATENDIFISE